MDENELDDGSSDFRAGQDASKEPSLIAENAFAAGVNVTTQEGIIGPRDGWAKRKLKFPEGGYTLRTKQVRSYADIFHSGRYQAHIPYSIGRDYYQLIIISGLMFLVNQNTYEVRMLEITDKSILNEKAIRINWSVAGRYLVIFDFPSYPVIIDGIEARRADPAKYEVPISVLGAYNQNRLMIANAGNEWTGGDPAGNLATPNAPITFEEVLAPNAAYPNQVSQLTTNYNNEPITAMGFLQSIDASTGIGPFVVSTESMIYTYMTQNPRANWQAGQFGSAMVETAGIAGQYAQENVNGDLFYMDSECQIRSLSMSRDEQSRWSKTPISREVKNWLKLLNPNLASYSVLNYFNNRIFATANPYFVDSLDLNGFPILDIAFGGFVVLETANVSTMTAGANPAWAGLWTGVRPMSMCTNNKRCFVMSKDPAYSNELYELTTGVTVDQDSDGTQRDIRSILYTRRYGFKDPFKNKRLSSIELAIRGIKGNFVTKIEWKPADSSAYLPWRIFSHKAPYRSCCVPQGLEVRGLASHEFRQLNFGPAFEQDGCNPVTKDSFITFREAQVRLEISGREWQLEGIKLRAIGLPNQNDTYSPCEDLEMVKIPKQCNSDWAYGGFQ